MQLPETIDITCGGVTTEFVKAYSKKIKACGGFHLKINNVRHVVLPYTTEGRFLGNDIINDFPIRGKASVTFKGDGLLDRFDLLTQQVEVSDDPLAEALKLYEEKWKKENGC